MTVAKAALPAQRFGRPVMTKTARASGARGVAPSDTRTSVTAGPVTPVTAMTNAERQRAFRQRQAEAKKAAVAKALVSACAAPRPPGALIVREAAPVAAIPTEPPLPELTPTPAVVGRPTLCRPRFCQDIVAIAKLGISLTGFAGKIGASYDTIKACVKVWPDLATAVSVAKAAALLRA